MKMYLIAIGAGIGYLAGNQRARQKAVDTFKQVKSSPQAKAIEERVSDKVTDLTTRGDRELDITDPSYLGDADAVDSGAYSSSQMSPR